MTTLADVLSQIRANESGGNYSLTPQQNSDYPNSHASGAYQFQPATWQQYTSASGIGTQYSEAYMAPPAVQDAVAAYAAMNGPGVNSSALWGASAPAGGYPAITDTGGLTPTSIVSGGGLSDTLTGGAQAASGAAGSTGSTSAGGWLADIESWFTRGFLIVVGLVLVAFGLWHIMGRPKLPTPATEV